MNKQLVTNFVRFYSVLNRMKYQGDLDELKCSMVRQYTRNRTESLREITLQEYYAMCRDLERIYGSKSEDMRKLRSSVLKLMQKIGIDTTNWTRINAFCQDNRIAKKEFAMLNVEDLEHLRVKLRIIQNKGGLRQYQKLTEPSMYVVLNDSLPC